jgi:survival-of-motor-neuron-related-splicing factor 30
LGIEFQLGQVQEALDKDPGNDELLKLKTDLQELITLYTQLVEAEGAAADSSVPDAKSAESSSVPQPASPKKTDFSNKKRDFNQTSETIAGAEVVVVSASAGGAGEPDQKKSKKYPSSSTATGGASVGAGADGKKQGHGNNGQKKERKQSKTEVIQNQKQSNWLNFAKSGKNKASSLGKKKSIFATSDNPHYVVGVTGSGQGMTDYRKKGKHIFEPSSRED